MATITLGSVKDSSVFFMSVAYEKYGEDGRGRTKTCPCGCGAKHRVKCLSTIYEGSRSSADAMAETMRYNELATVQIVEQNVG